MPRTDLGERGSGGEVDHHRSRKFFRTDCGSRAVCAGVPRERTNGGAAVRGGGNSAHPVVGKQIPSTTEQWTNYRRIDDRTERIRSGRNRGRNRIDLAGG